MRNFDLAEALYQDRGAGEETVTMNRNSSLWPGPIDDMAYQGLAGKIVKTIEPHTEADPVAILIQSMTAFGNVIGPGPHFKVEADRHPARLFAVIVGQTAKARKGTSDGIVTRLFEDIDKEWSNDRIKGGLSSGEGLIYHVRDIGSAGKDDPGVNDKRLWIKEPEFASVLKNASRDGNILSPVIRQAWDTGKLATLTKNNPVKATGAHVSITGHINPDELKRYLSQTEVFNGLANRFIWLCVRRSKILPEGGRIHTMDLTPLTDRIREAVQFSKSVDEIKPDREAKDIWINIYPELSEGKPGMIGAVLSRAESQVMRLACIYALMDCSEVVCKDHLLAALALWNYAETSVRYIFRDKTGDDVADRIYQALRESKDGLTRTDIASLFYNHKSKERIDEAIELLRKYKQVNIVRESTGGRPSERIMGDAK
jgi:hypothetical protein